MNDEQEEAAVVFWGVVAFAVTDTVPGQCQCRLKCKV